MCTTYLSVIISIVIIIKAAFIELVNSWSPPFILTFLPDPRDARSDHHSSGCTAKAGQQWRGKDQWWDSVWACREHPQQNPRETGPWEGSACAVWGQCSGSTRWYAPQILCMYKCNTGNAHFTFVTSQFEVGINCHTPTDRWEGTDQFPLHCAQSGGGQIQQPP